MLINEDELDTRLASIEAQLRKMWKLHGLPSEVVPLLETAG